MEFDLVDCEMEEIRRYIKKCQKNEHTQQVAYSSYHSSLTQICFNCQRIRSNINKNGK